MSAEEKYTTDDLFDSAVEVSMNTGLIENGDLVVITAGVPVGISGFTNILKVHLVGHVLVQGKPVNNLTVSGNVCIVDDLKRGQKEFHSGDILVMKSTNNDVMDLLKHASAIVTEEDGVTSHGAIAGMALNIPCHWGQGRYQNFEVRNHCHRRQCKRICL